MNLIAFAEIAGAFLVSKAVFLWRLIGTTQLTAGQWGLGLLMTLAVPVSWEAGK
jgi:hypothetical protein